MTRSNKKKQPALGTSAAPAKAPTTARPGRPSPSSAAADDIMDIFSVIQKSKGAKRPREVEPHRVRSCRDARELSAAQRSKSSVKPKKSGLYVAPEKSIQMSDNAFFAGTWLKKGTLKAGEALSSSGDTGLADGGGHGDSAISSNAEQDQLRSEGVDRIVSMEELSSMLSRSRNAGNTENCPFDCDCCF